MIDRPPAISGPTVAGRVPIAVIVALFAVVLVALTLVGVLTSPLDEGPPPLSVDVDGRTMLVQRGATLADLIRARGLRARAGRLLDVEGFILERRADPGEIQLNGLPVARSTPLQDGDTINVIDGANRTEDTTRSVRRLRDPIPPNPATVMGKAKAVEITIRGEISGKVVQTFTKPVAKVDRPDEVALTFDDGPWPGTTAKILSILQRFRAKATFFVIGSQAERRPDLIRRELAAGMTVANHSWSHPGEPTFRELAPTRLDEEISLANQQLGLQGVSANLFRPPGGSWDREVRETASSYGMRMVLWDVDPRDWRSDRKPKQIVHSVLSGVRPGSIVLLHDGGGDAQHTIEALPEIIKGIRKLGLKLVAL